jgi:hypothetical protein
VDVVGEAGGGVVGHVAVRLGPAGAVGAAEERGRLLPAGKKRV